MAKEKARKQSLTHTLDNGATPDVLAAAFPVVPADAPSALPRSPLWALVEAGLLAFFMLGSRHHTHLRLDQDTEERGDVNSHLYEAHLNWVHYKTTRQGEIQIGVVT